jgi:hypothetical protein
MSSSALPTVEVPKGPGSFGPDYSFADNVKLPGQVGVRKGDDMQSVADSLKATAYYIDTIGFGEPSSGMSQGLGLKPLGVNTWTRTGVSCTNGADMWVYNTGIPTGNALGKRVSDGLASAGLPGLRGLGPGILEDVQTALDPRPVMSAMFGPATPVCRLNARVVGDQDGRIQNPDTKNYYVNDPETVYYVNGQPMQKRWEQVDTAAEGDSSVKTHCPDGYPIRNHKDSLCDGKLLSKKENFCGGSGDGDFCDDGAQKPRKDGWKQLVLAMVAAAGLLVIIRVVNKRL